MRHIEHTISSHRWLRARARFLVVWLASALIAWGILPWLMWVTGELLLLAHLFAAGVLMGWLRQPPEARNPEWRAMGKGAQAAVLVMWCNLAVFGVYMLINPPAEPGRLSGAVAILGPLFLGSLLALIVGWVGGMFGALLAYNLRRGRRRGSTAPMGVSE
jgi:hypothetical protein